MSRTCEALVMESDTVKQFVSHDYNYIFRKIDGTFARWGATKDDDPQWSPFGNEILDIEVTTSCDNGCPFCYKSNTPNGKNMSFEMFKSIIDKMPPTLTQIAIGADARGRSNPDMLRMMHYCRSVGIVPNITVANIDEDMARALAGVCGAVAVSRYTNKDACYNSIAMLDAVRSPTATLKQVNIHQLVAEETFENAMDTVRDITSDPRLSGLYALIFLSLKQKGRGAHFTPLSMNKFKDLVNTAIEGGVMIGFDSCSAHKAQKIILSDFSKDTVEPCESSCFSAYIDVDGDFYPCSFAEGVPGWETGINVPYCVDFLKDVWMNERTMKFREVLLANGRRCPLYEI